MKLGKTLAMLVVFLLLYYLSHKVLQKKEKSEEIEEKEKKIFSYVDLKNVSTLSIKNSEGLFEFKQNTNGNWDIISPIKDDGSKSTIDEIITSIKNLEIKKRLPEAVKDLSMFGLAQPSCEINFTLADNKKEVLFLGGKTPDDSSLYVKHGSEKNVLISGSTLEHLKTKKLTDFREKKIFGFKKDDVKEISITNSNGEFLIKKISANKYAIEKPRKMDGGKSEVEKIINTLINSRINEFVSETFDNPKLYGLEKPSIKIDMALTDEKKSNIILSEKGEKYYLKKSEKENVYEVSSQLFKDLNVKLEDLILKKLLEFEKESIKRIDYTFGDKSFSFIKKNENEWGVLPPWNFTASYSEISGLLSKVKNIESGSIVSEKIDNPAKFGFNSPRIKMSIAYGEADKEETSGFIIGNEKDKENYFMKRLDTNFVYTIKKSDIDKFPSLKNDFREKNLVSFNRDDITEVTLYDKSKKATFIKEKEKWIVNVNGEKKTNPKQIEGLITDVRSLKVLDFIDKSVDDKMYSFNDPKLNLDIVKNKKEKISLLIGKVEAEAYFAKIVNKSEAITIEKFRVENILKKFREL